jgi:hypothetical protein
MCSICNSTGHVKVSPGSSQRDHVPVAARESTGAVVGSSATQTCFAPAPSGHPPSQIHNPRYGVSDGSKRMVNRSPRCLRTSAHQPSPNVVANSLSPIPELATTTVLRSTSAPSRVTAIGHPAESPLFPRRSPAEPSTRKLMDARGQQDARRRHRWQRADGQTKPRARGKPPCW